MNEGFPNPQPAESQAEKRQQVEASMGPAIETLFARDPSPDNDGEGRNITLYGDVDHRGKVPEARVREDIGVDGARSVFMIFDGGAWPGAGFKYAESPGVKPSLTAIKETDGKVIELPGDSISQTDYDVAYWGKVWLNNFETMHTEPPRVDSARKLGRIAAFFSRKSN